MAVTDLIRINITGHGAFTITANGFDVMIARHLPASPYDLRKKINALGHGMGDDHYDDVHTVTELLMILADYEGFGQS